MKNTKSKNYNWIFILFVIIFFSIVVYLLYQGKSSKVLPIQPTIESTRTSIPTATNTPNPPTPAPPPTPAVSPTAKNTLTFTPPPPSSSTQQPTELPPPILTPTNLPDFGLTHEIQPGQYLTGISLHYYGTGRRWDDIYEATNARAGEGRYQKIDNPNLIFPNDWLMIPIIE